MCVNHPKPLSHQKLSNSLGLFCFKSFHGLVIVGGRMERIVCPVFYLVIKIREHLYKNPYQKWQTAVKTFKNHVPTGTHKNRQILLHRFLLITKQFLKLKREVNLISSFLLFQIQISINGEIRVLDFWWGNTKEVEIFKGGWTKLG